MLRPRYFLGKLLCSQYFLWDFLSQAQRNVLKEKQNENIYFFFFPNVKMTDERKFRIRISHSFSGQWTFTLTVWVKSHLIFQIFLYDSNKVLVFFFLASYSFCTLSFHSLVLELENFHIKFCWWAAGDFFLSMFVIWVWEICWFFVVL